MLKFVKFINDPIYGYIGLTEIEFDIVQNANYFERLKYIKQLGMAYHVYPSAVHTRFEHSLGTMFVAGNMIEAVLTNHDSYHYKIWFSEYKESLSHIRENGLFSITDSQYKHLISFDGIIQLVRIAALLHDIGHLPFSHTFEDGLESLFKGSSELKNKHLLEAEKYYREEFSKSSNLFSTLINQSINNFFDTSTEQPLHEKLGHKIIASEALGIADVLQNYFGKSITQLIVTLFEFPEEFTRSINANIQSKKNIDWVKNPSVIRFWHALHFLKEFISGSIDADRLDYVTRDIQKSGFKPVSYDLQRIIQNLVLKQDSNNMFRLAIKDKAIAEIESFYISRFLCYKSLYYHPTVKIMGHLCAILTHIFFEFYDENSKSLQQILQYDLIGNDTQREFIDDAWLLNKFRKMHKMSVKSISNPWTTKTSFISSLDSLIETVTYRKNLPIALWKSVQDFLTPLNSILEDQVYPSLGSNAEELFNNFSKIEKVLDDDQQKFWRKFLPIIENAIKPIFSDINIEIDILNVMLLRTKTKKYSYNDILIYNSHSDKLKDIANTSSLIKSIRNPINEFPPYMLYIQLGNHKQRAIFKKIITLKRLIPINKDIITHLLSLIEP